MAKNAALFVGWGKIPSGKAKKALKVFNEANEFWKRMQQKGEIDSFENIFLEVHGGELGGFNLVRGDREKLNRIRMSVEFERLISRSSLIVNDLGVVDAYFGEEIQRRLGDWVKDVEELD